MNQTHLNYPLGWTPSADPVNGDPTGLARMDNLQQEENGALGVVRGMRQLTNSLPDYVFSLYSTTLNNKEPIYAALNQVGRAVVRSLNGQFTDTTTILSNGGNKTAFGSALGEVCVVCGTQAKKDDGTTIRNLGLLDQVSGPTVNIQPPALIDLSTNGTWSVIDGINPTIFGPGGGIQIYLNPVTLQANILFTFAAPVDTTAFGTGITDNYLNDVLNFLAQIQDSSQITDIRLQVILDNNPLQPLNYYWDDFNVQDGQFNLGITQQSIVGDQRQSFTRQGGDSSLDWKHVTALQFIITGISSSWVLINQQQIVGGPLGTLNGVYQYLTVAIYDNGIYQAKSAVSPITNNILVQNSFVKIPLVATDPQANQVWVFRRSMVSSTDPIYQTFISQNKVPANLNQFYLVAQGAPGTTVTDNTSDVIALETNIVANQFLMSIQDLITIDNIVAMEGMYYERMLYVSESTIYLSDPLNPDAVDTRYSIKAFAGTTEKNLWLKKLNPSQLVLATTKDHYLITGTLESLPDGTVDATISPIGEKYPSLSGDVANGNGTLFYPAADGIRATQGSNSVSISQQLRLLWQGNTRYGIPGVDVFTQYQVPYSLAAGKTKLFCTVPMLDGTRRVLVYDVVLQTWRLLFTDPIAVCTTPSDRIIAGYGEQTEGIWELETGAGVQAIAGTQGYPITMQTVFDCNGQPRNRKDTFTLKLICDCGGSPVNVFISKDSNDPVNSFTQIATISNNGMQTNYIPLNNVTLGFRYAIKLTDVNGVTVFKLYETTIEYEPRPEQLDYMRIIPTNLGTVARKRFTAYAVVIDTLGNNISFTPYVDNSAQSPYNFSTATKLTQIFYFTSETIGTDIGGIFSGGVFEFYTVVLEECVSEKLPTPVEFLVIPANNYGTPNRKRHTSYKFQILTRGQPVLFTPILDGVPYATATFNTTIKKTVEYFFPPGDVIGIDVGGTLASLAATPFEFYGVITPQQIEQLPDRLEYFVIPPNDYGVPNRKRHSSYKFQINTNGQNVTFTPIIDTVAQTPAIFNTNGKQTVEYFFYNDTIGIDIGGTLQGASPFEFYQVIVPQTVEKLPDRLTFYKTPNTNFGVAARKRLRTIPIVIDTYGSPVTFTPIVDGVLQGNTTTLTTTGKTTTFHYFVNDVFGTDFGGTFESQTTQPFEFYEYSQPEDVETLPVAKKYDQLGPARFDKIGKLFGFRIRLIMNGTTQSLPFEVLGDLNVTDPTYGNPVLYSGTIPVFPGLDNVYEIQFPKSVNTDIFRLVLGPTTDTFHRYDIQVKMQASGMESDSQWIPLR